MNAVVRVLYLPMSVTDTVWVLHRARRTYRGVVGGDEIPHVPRHARKSKHLRGDHAATQAQPCSFGSWSSASRSVLQLRWEPAPCNVRLFSLPVFGLPPPPRACASIARERGRRGALPRRLTRAATVGRLHVASERLRLRQVRLYWDNLPLTRRIAATRARVGRPR